MSTATVNNSKKTITKENSKFAETTKKVVSLNLDAFTAKLAKMDVKETTLRASETMYIYPANFTKKMIGDKEGRQFRNKQRKIMQNFANEIFVYTKSKQPEKLQETVKRFLQYYKETYRVNDFSLNSLCNSPEQEKKDELQFMLQIVQSVNAQITGEKTEKKKTATTATKKKETPTKGKETPTIAIIDVPTDKA